MTDIFGSIEPLAQEPLLRQNIIVNPSPAEIRKRLNVSQHAFAGLLGVSVRTIQDWEQGRRAPSGPALALLRIVDRQPEILLRAPE